MAGAPQVSGLQEYHKTSHTQKETGRREGGQNVKRENNKLYALTLLIAAPAWIALLAAKGRGSVGINWPTAILGAVWIPALTLAALLALTGVLVLLHEATKRIHEWKRRRKVARTLWESMEGLTLNNTGPIYGIRRQPGEKNRSYKRRILKAARTLDTVNVQNAPTPATGQKLDAIAKKHGLRRYPHETDEQLQNRIREAVLKNLEGGRKNGRV